jgi:predicted restriction endonuclease
MIEVSKALDAITQLPKRRSEESNYQDESADYTGREVVGVSRHRKGQELFRVAVLSAYSFQCCVTGVSDHRFLVASHIKPWSVDKENRLNPSNGLCLSTFYDRAFDLGLISFDPNYRLLVSSDLKKQADNHHIRETFLERSGMQLVLPEKFSPSNELLAWHRDTLFTG